MLRHEETLRERLTVSTVHLPTKNPSHRYDLDAFDMLRGLILYDRVFPATKDASGLCGRRS